MNESAKLPIAGCLACTTGLMLLTGLAYGVGILGRRRHGLPLDRTCLVLVAPRSLRSSAALAGAAFVVAVGCSVLVLNRHFPSDVVGGRLVAGAWLFAVLAALSGR